MDANDIRLLLRAIFIAAGGRHDDSRSTTEQWQPRGARACSSAPERITTNPE